jgi:hypothetical protein
MKRIFLVCAVAISAMALATASNGTGSGKNSASSVNSGNYQDTIPKKDTTPKPKRDTMMVMEVR